MTERTDPPDWALPAWDALDPHEASARPSGRSGTPPTSGSPPGAFGLRIRTVTEVTRTIRGVVRSDPRLTDVWVEGEIGRVTVSSAGHAYFTLRDDRSQLQCVWFRDDRLVSAFEARAGLRVVVNGRIDLYEPTGALQLYVAGLQPAGFGDLALRLEQLKARLAAEGIFDRAHKRPIPERPSVIAAVTSPSGAVWHDIRTVLGRRWPLTRVLLVPCQVQGDGAPASIVAALERLTRHIAACERDGRADEAPAVTIIARGGGSLEDLWPFNDERVVRAVVAHPVPVVSGVGHEVDVTLVDLAADVRAATPSAAAELVVPDGVEVAAHVRATGRRLTGLGRVRLDSARGAVAAERRALARLDPRVRLAMSRERTGRLLDAATRAIVGRIDAGRRSEEGLAGRFRPIIPRRLASIRAAMERSSTRLPYLVGTRLTAARAMLATTAAALAVLGPQATLDRGYAIVRTDPDGRIVRDPIEAPSGTRLRIRVAHGDLPAVAADATGPPRPGPVS